MQTLTDIRIYTGAMRREGDDLHATDVKLVSNEWVYINADDESTNIVRVPVGAVCECEPQPIPEPTPRCDNSGTNVLATLLRGADGDEIIGGYFSSDGSLYLNMSDGSEVFAGKIDLSNYYTKSEVDGKRLPNPFGLNYSFNGTSATYDGSMSKYLPSIYAPSSAGKKGQILSSNGAGEPVWVDAPSLSGAEVKWEDVQNKPTTIKGFGINDAYTKSEVDGKLDDKVGKDEAIEFAKDLTGVPETTPEEFTFRTSAGTKSIRDESAVIRRIKGNTTVWSQSIPSPENWRAYLSENLSTSVNDGVYRATLLKDFTDGSARHRLGTRLTIPPTTVGHKYFVGGWVRSSIATANDNYGLEHRGQVYTMYPSVTVANTWTYVGRVFTLANLGSGTTAYLQPPWNYVHQGLAGNWYEAKDFVLIDLTDLYDAGNEPSGDSANATVQAESIKQFKKLYPESYYQYCEPEVRSMRATGIETIGANAFDKDSVVGGLINADGSVTSNDIYSVAKIEVVPYEKYTLTRVANAANTTYTYALYDSEDNFISVGEIKNSVTKPVSVSGDVTMPMNARYMRVVVHNDYLDSCCVNLKHSGTLTAEEAVYFKEVRTLPDIAKYFPEGMHGIGDVFDEINEENIVKRFGVVDLGTLTWNVASTGTTDIYRWQSFEFVARPTSSVSEVPNIICIKYKTGSANDTWAKIDCINVSLSGRLFLFDSNYTTAADKDAFVASLQGVLLYYELAEPIVTPVTDPLQWDYKVADFGTEKMLSDLPSSPFRADIVYQFNAEGRIRDNSRNIERLESIVDSVKDDEGYLYSNGEKVDMRFTRSLIPIGTSIPAKANLNTVAYLKVGKYYCSLNADAKTITNCPTATAFMMEVFNPLSTVVDNEVDSTYVYRIRILTEYSTGIQYVQYCTVGSTANKWTYDSWYVCPRTKFTLNSSKNDGTAAIGSKTQGVFVDSTGTLQKMAYSLNKTVPSDAVFTDTQVTAVEKHYAPAEDESAALNAPSGTVVTGIKRDAAGHVVGIVTAVGGGGGGTVDLSNYYTKQEIEDKGYVTEDEIPTTLPNPLPLEITVDGVAQSYNGNEAVRIGVTTPKEADVAGWGFTKNAGTITGIKMNGVSKGVSGEVDLGTVITDISGKQDVISDLATIRSGASKGATAVQPSQLANVATSGSYKDLKDTPAIPSALSDLTDDSTHRTVTDTEKTTWSNKSDFSGSYADLNDKPSFKTINGESILGDGNITISGGSSASGSAQLPLEKITANVGQSVSIPSGKVTVFTALQTEGRNFLISTTDTKDGEDNVWIIRFGIGAANTGIYEILVNDPGEIGIYRLKWANGVAPTFENGKYYEISFRLIGQTFLGVWASFG